MESYRFITRTLAAITITGFALAANPSLGAVAIDIQDKSSDLNLSARQKEQNLGQLNDQDIAYVTSLREHYHLM